MRKVKVLFPIRVDGESRKVGDVVEVSDGDARMLVGIGRGEYVDGDSGKGKKKAAASSDKTDG